MDGKKEKKKRNPLILIIQIILIGIILYSSYKIIEYNYGRYKAGKLYDQYKEGMGDPSLINKGLTGQETSGDKKEDKKRFEALTKEGLAKLRKKNSDIIAYLNIPDLGISYPVVFKDNEYYLRRDLNKQYSLAGTLFVEELNKKDFSDMNTIIYGHNMSNAIVKSSQMFEPLIKLGEKDYVSSKDKHYIELYTDQGVKIYRVFSAHYAVASSDYRTLNIADDKKVGYLNSLKDKSRVKFLDYEFNTESKILTLSTCDNVTDEGRFAVHAVLMEEYDEL